MAKKKAAKKKGKKKGKLGPNMAPTGQGFPDWVFGGQMNVGGGQIQAEQQLASDRLANEMQMGQMQIGQGLMGYLTDLQRDPFSIVPAMQAYSASGGGTLAPNAAMVDSGGLGQPSPYGNVVQNLIRGLSEFAGGTNINPATGQSYTPAELAAQRKQPVAKPVRRATTPKKKKKGGVTAMPTGGMGGSYGNVNPTRGIGDLFKGLTPDQLNSMLGRAS